MSKGEELRILKLNHVLIDLTEFEEINKTILKNKIYFRIA